MPECGCSRPLSAVLVNVWIDNDLETYEAVSRRYFHLRLLARALSDLGHKIYVLQAFHTTGAGDLDGVPMRTVARSLSPGGLSVFSKFLGGSWPVREEAMAYEKALCEIGPDVVHLVGLMTWRNQGPCAAWARRKGRVMTASDHGGRPERHPIAWLRQRRTSAGLDAVFLPSAARKTMWRRGSIWPRDCEARILPEATTEFRLLDRNEAQAATGMHGEPIICWTANLIPDKRPMLALQAFEKVLDAWPTARLYMAYRFDDMLPELRAYAARSPRLESATAFMGTLSREAMEHVYNSADIFLTTSSREIGSISLAEAFACGTQPVCFDLPSYRVLTGEGRFAAVVQDPTPDAFARAILSCARRTPSGLRTRLRDHFDKSLGYPALASAYVETWRRAIARRGQ